MMVFCLFACSIDMSNASSTDGDSVESVQTSGNEGDGWADIEFPQP
jgi:hypothetical protein